MKLFATLFASLAAFVLGAMFALAEPPAAEGGPTDGQPTIDEKGNSPHPNTPDGGGTCGSCAKAGLGCCCCCVKPWPAAEQGTSAAIFDFLPDPPIIITANDKKPVADPVVATGGKLFIPYVDVEIPGPGRFTGTNLEFYRAYNNQDSRTGVLGTSWVTNLDIELWQTGSTYTVRDFDGTLIKMQAGAFPRQSVGVTNGAGLTNTYFGNDNGFKHGSRTLKQLGDLTWEFTKTYGTRYYFNANGKINSIKDRNGNSLTYGRNGSGQITSITDSAGKSLTFTYSSGRLHTMHDEQLERTWTYTVEDDNLVSVEDPMVRTWVYEYDDTDPHNSTTLTNRRGHSTTYEYDTNDRVIRVDYPGHVNEFTFDDGNATSTYEDGDGKVWTYTYANPGLVTRVKTPSPQNKNWDFVYDSTTKQMTSRTSPRLDGGGSPFVTSTYSYNSVGVGTGGSYTGDRTIGWTIMGTPGSYGYVGYLATTSTDSKNETATRLFDQNGNVMKYTDRRGKHINLTYTAKGFPETLTDRNGEETSWTWDDRGNPLSVTDPTDRTLQFEYDAASRMTKIVDELNHAVVYTYDDCDRIVEVERANVTSTGSNTWSVSSVLRETFYGYDEEDNLDMVTDATDRTTWFTYNFDNRLESTIDPSGQKTTYTYNGRGLPMEIKIYKFVTSSYVLLRTTNYTYDDTGRMTLAKETPAGGSEHTLAEMTYDPDDMPATLKDANNRTTTFTYDPTNRKRTTTFPDNSTEIHEYNTVGDMISFTPRSGSSDVRTYTYDEEHRKTAQDCPTCGAAFYYDDEGRLFRVDDAVAGTFGYQYDDAGRLLVSHQPDGSTPSTSAPNPVPSNYGLKVTYTYDDVGRRASMTYPNSSFVTYEYDALDQPYKIHDGSGTGHPVYEFDWDDAGRRERVTFPNGCYTQWIFNTGGLLTDVVSKTSSATVLTSDHLIYGDLHQITGDEISNGKTGGRTYGYDARLRLNTANISSYGNGLFSGISNVTYNYDSVGNRTSVVVGSTTTTYSLASSPAWNEYSAVGSATLTYNSKHCLTGDGTRTMTYDADNRLTQATKSGTTVSFAYDWQNHIVTKTIGSTLDTRYVYDDWDVIAEYDGSGNLKRTYIHGPEVDEILLQGTTGGGSVNLLRDHLGSTMALVNALGTSIQQRYTYDAYGNATVRDSNGDPSSASLLTNYLYTGREWQPEIALYNYRNRFYHPEIGRFLQPDPIGFDGGDVNLFGYVSNLPTNALDPDGLQPGAYHQPNVPKLDELPQGFVDSVSGLGDSASFGVSRVIRCGFQYDGEVDKSSIEYRAGSFTGCFLGLARLAYAGLAKAGSVVASSGAAASAFRSKLKTAFGGSPKLRPAKTYETDAKLRGGAGRTNPYCNLWGAGATAEGAKGGMGYNAD